MRPYLEGQDFTNIIRAAIPDFVESEYPLFVAFVEAYLRYLEQPRTFEQTSVVPQYGNTQTVMTTSSYGGALYEARKLLEYRDSETTIEDFRTQFMSMFGKNFPVYAYVPTDWVVRTLRSFYQNKGTANGIRWFFRTFFNETADVYYPREDVFVASGATWYAPYTIKVGLPINGTNDDIDRYYTGSFIRSDTGQAQVDRVARYTVRSGGVDVIVNELFLKTDSIQGTFSANQRIVNVPSDSTVPEILTTTLPIITGITINNGGADYAVDDQVVITTIDNAPGVGAYGRVSLVANAALGGIAVTAEGAGYVNAEPILFSSSSGTGATGYITITPNANSVLALDLTIASLLDISANVADYGTASGDTDYNTIDFDDPVSLVFQLADVIPFYVPWVWTDASNTAATLAEASIVVENYGTELFVNTAIAISEGRTGQFFLIDDVNDTTTNVTSATTTASSVGYFGPYAGNTSFSGSTKLYLSSLTGNTGLAFDRVIKQDYVNIQSGTVTTSSGNTVVTGVGTQFDVTVTGNSHIRIGDAFDGVVSSVINATALTLRAAAPSTRTANTYGTYALGRVSNTVIWRAQTVFGTISAGILTSAGTNYAVPPTLTIDNMDARIQSEFFWNTATSSVNTGALATIYEDGALSPLAGRSQIVKIDIQNSGVDYRDENKIVVTALHNASGNTNPAANASLTAVLGAISQRAGEFTSTRSFASSSKSYLQDKVYYNDYTYVVKVSESFDRYRDMLYTLLHPAGFNVYGEFVLRDTMTTNLLSNTYVGITYVNTSSSFSSSFSPSSSLSPSASTSPSASKSPSASSSASPSPSASWSPSASLSPSASPSRSFSPSASKSPSASLSRSTSPSASSSASSSSSYSPSASTSPSASSSASPSPSASTSPSASVSPSASSSASVSRSASKSPSSSPSRTPSASVSPSA